MDSLLCFVADGTIHKWVNGARMRVWHRSEARSPLFCGLRAHGPQELVRVVANLFFGDFAAEDRLHHLCTHFVANSTLPRRQTHGHLQLCGRVHLRISVTVEIDNTGFVA